MDRLSSPTIAVDEAASTPPQTSILSAIWQRDRVLLGLVLIAALLGLIYNGVILLGKGADEPRHMAYVQLLLNEHQFPFLEPDPSNPSRMREHAGAHTLHPPLYYLILLPVYALTRGLGENTAWHLTRLVSLLLCLATLPLIYQMAQVVGQRSTTFARLGVAQVALLPIFGMTAGTINNDSATFFAVTLFLWLLAVKYPRDHSLKSALILGICFGLGALCKATSLICDGAALVVYLLVQDGWRKAITSPRPWLRFAIVVLCVVVIAGPWYGRNLLMYHKMTPIEAGYSTTDLKWLPSTSMGLLVVLLHPNFPPLFASANWSIFYTMWSQKDWIPEGLRTPVYVALAAYCVLAIVGLILLKVRRQQAQQDAVEIADAGYNTQQVIPTSLWSSFAAFAFNWLACLAMALFVHWGWAEGGRYLLPSLCGLSLLLAWGWSGLMGLNRLPSVLAVWCVGLIGLNCVTIYWLLHYLNPTFGNS
ncbi:MAG: glycosyltransferase family 39 protein [Abitibacteriaceae bacterium]|nr:glycosyltransferase family 39 protein [Abditibacteriaceae bacterium]